MIDIRQTNEWADYMFRIGWVVETLHNQPQNTYIYIRKLSPLPFSMMKIQRIQPDNCDLLSIKEMCKKYRIIDLLIEFDDSHWQDYGWSNLTDQYQRLGFYKTLDTMLPSKTRVINLTQSQDSLDKQMKTKTHYNINLSKRRGVTVNWYTGKQLMRSKKLYNTFFDIYESNNKRIGVHNLPKLWIESHFVSFGEKAWIAFACSKTNNVIAVALFLEGDRQLIYFYNGSTVVGRKDMAPSLIIWEAISKARQCNLLELDFEGVIDERRPNKRWAGFTKFKESFGGHNKYFPPMYRQFLPLWR